MTRPTVDIGEAKKRVRARDPITSLTAAEGAEAFALSHAERIYRALGCGPMTAHELSVKTGLTVVQIDRRLPELKGRQMAEVVESEGTDMVRDGFRVWQQSKAIGSPKNLPAN